MPKLPDHIFKPYLAGTPSYVGGKSINEIETKADKIYKLSSNENDLGFSPSVRSAVMDALDKVNTYPERTDRAICDFIAAHGDVPLPKEQFMITPSGSEMLDLIVRGFLGPGLNAIASSPCFMPYMMFAKNQGATVKDAPLRGGTYELDVEAILGAIDADTRLLFMASPNNPTGTYLTKDTIEAVLDGVPDHVIVVLDEVYHHYVEADDYSRAYPYVAQGHSIIGLNSFSKAYGLAGLRIGYAYGPTKVMDYLHQLWKPFLLNSLSGAALQAAILDKDFLGHTSSTIQAERSRVCAALDEMGVKYVPSQANFILIDAAGDESGFEAKMLEHGVMIRPAGGFGCPGYVRVTLGRPEANDAFLRGLKAIV